MCAAGFVIMTSQIFKNKNFFTLGTGNKNLGMNMDALKKRGPCVAKYLQVLNEFSNALHTLIEDASGSETTGT
jgi:hypothetical protein